MNYHTHRRQQMITKKPILFKEGQGASYSNKHFILEHEIRVDGNLELNYCTVEIRAGFLHGDGAIRFFNCEIIGRGHAEPQTGAPIYAPNGYFGKCVFRDFKNAPILLAKEISSCSFENCGAACCDTHLAAAVESATSLPEVGSKEALPSKDPFDDVDMIRSSFRKIANEETGEE